MSPRPLLLDLDRTLVDVQSYTDYPAAVADVERVMGSIELGDLPDTEWASDTKKAMAILVALAPDPARWQQASDLIEVHERVVVSAAQAMPGLDDFLSATANRPRVIVTLMGPGAMDSVCDRFGIDVALRIGRTAGLVPKPAPDQVIAACDLLGMAPAKVVMIGDSTWDREAALAAGADFIGLTNGKPSEFPEGTPLATSLLDALRLL
jgi:phosphoglycolate phosphatase-like HAD superfamily hydrolase